LDIEEINNPMLTPSKIKICLEELEQLFQRTPMVYTRASVWNPKIGKVLWASRYPLWVAHYTLAGWQTDHIARTLSNTSPSLPGPWPDYAIWQISDKCPASYYGVSGTTVDVNAAREEALAKLISPAAGDDGEETSALPPGSARVLVQGLSLRSRPRVENNVVATLNAGEIVQVLNTYREDETIVWRAIMRTDRRVGWAAEWYPTLVDSAGKLRPGLEVSE
jgi:hypothetical protein